MQDGSTRWDRHSTTTVIYYTQSHSTITALLTISQLISEPKSPVSMEITAANQDQSSYMQHLTKDKLQENVLLVRIPPNVWYSNIIKIYIPQMFGVGNKDVTNQKQARRIQLQLHQVILLMIWFTCNHGDVVSSSLEHRSTIRTKTQFWLIT